MNKIVYTLLITLLFVSSAQSNRLLIIEQSAGRVLETPAGQTLVRSLMGTSRASELSALGEQATEAAVIARLKSIQDQSVQNDISTLFAKSCIPNGMSLLGWSYCCVIRLNQKMKMVGHQTKRMDMNA